MGSDALKCHPELLGHEVLSGAVAGGRGRDEQTVGSQARSQVCSRAAVVGEEQMAWGVSRKADQQKTGIALWGERWVQDVPWHLGWVTAE